jgi:hypothetical protein
MADAGLRGGQDRHSHKAMHRPIAARHQPAMWAYVA